MEPPFIRLHWRYWSAVSERCLELCGVMKKLSFDGTGWKVKYSLPLKKIELLKESSRKWVGVCDAKCPYWFFFPHWTKSRNSEVNIFCFPVARIQQCCSLCLSSKPLLKHLAGTVRSRNAEDVRVAHVRLSGNLFICSFIFPTNQPKSLPKITYWTLSAPEFLFCHGDELMSQKETISVPMEYIV